MLLLNALYFTELFCIALYNLVLCSRRSATLTILYCTLCFTAYSIILHWTLLHCTLLNCIVLYNIHSTVQYSTAQYSTVQHSIVQYSTVQCSQYTTALYSIIRYSTLHYNAVQYSIEQRTRKIILALIYPSRYVHCATCTCLQRDPTNARNYLMRGNILFRKNKYSEALADFTEVLNTDPTNVECLYNRGAYVLPMTLCSMSSRLLLRCPRVIHINASVCVYICLYIYVCVCVCVCFCLCVYILIYMRVCFCVYLYVRTQIHLPLLPFDHGAEHLLPSPPLCPDPYFPPFDTHITH